MNGRNIFKKMKILISICQGIVLLIPKFILNFFWNMFNPSESIIALFFRYLYIKKYSRVCGGNIYIGKNVTIKNIKYLSLGNNISIHAGCYVDASGGVIIDDNVSIANQSSLISFEHTWQDSELPIKYNEIVLGKIHLNKDVWIGTGCRILSGVTIESRSIVAAGAVVTKNVKAKTIVGGVPAKVIKNI